jgi:hypothetical protein
MFQVYKYCYFNFADQVFCEVGGRESEANPRGGGPIICIWSIVYFFVKNLLLLLLFVERSIFIFCGTIHFYILWNDPFMYFVERSIFIFLWNSPSFIFCGTVHLLYFVEQSIFIFCGTIVP